jgi:hypothetical protein
MKTAFALLAQYDGKAVIPVESVCADYFAPLTLDQFLRKTLAGEIKLPILEGETGKVISVDDLALYIDQRVAIARAEVIKEDESPIPPQRPPGVVYLIAAGEMVKIGFSADLGARFAALQTTSPVKLELLASIPGTYATERDLHVRFATQRSHGEWFKREGDLAEWIAAGCKQ